MDSTLIGAIALVVFVLWTVVRWFQRPPAHLPLQNDPDPAYGDPEVATVLQATGPSRWVATRELWARTTEPDLRSTRFHHLAAHQPFDAVKASVDADPTDVLAQATLTVLMTGRAWTARTGLSADQVSRKQFAEFHRLLQIAFEHGKAGLSHANGNPLPAQALLPVARGLQFGHDDANTLFEASLMNQHTPWEPHLQLLQYRCDKWFGSHDWMFQTAREWAKLHPASPLAALLVVAHMEYAFADDAAGIDQVIDEARPEIAKAFDAWHEAGALHPDDMHAACTFAWYFDMLGDRPRLAKALRRADGRIACGMWVFEPGLRRRAKRAHRKVGLPIPRTLARPPAYRDIQSAT